MDASNDDCTCWLKLIAFAYDELRRQKLVGAKNKNHIFTYILGHRPLTKKRKIPEECTEDRLSEEPRRKKITEVITKKNYVRFLTYLFKRKGF